MDYITEDTICAIATVQGISAIAVIRLSGAKSISIADSIFCSKNDRKLADSKTHTIRFGVIEKEGDPIDEVLVSIFRSPHSFTGEDSIEIFCHGSIYVQQEILMLLISKGARLASAGEFSRRAFTNGKMDLAQLEAVSDLIYSETEAAHKIAMQQMRGGFSKELSQMRISLLDMASLMELELDFSDEDVEFIDSGKFSTILYNVMDHIYRLMESFKLGNVIRNGVPVTIAGPTNTGKSTLLNAILGEERAIVSDIHGTTRDFIEDTIAIGGMNFRFIDTAGIRETAEHIELMGIERTFEKIKSASVVLFMLDAERIDSFQENIAQLAVKMDCSSQKVIFLLNKCDMIMQLIGESDLHAPTVYGQLFDYFTDRPAASRYYDKILIDLKDDIYKIAMENGIEPSAILSISAKGLIGIDDIRDALVKTQKEIKIDSSATMVCNVRHYQALKNAYTALERLSDNLNNHISNDFLVQDLHEALFHIGEIVGEITTDEILGNIFSKFCIGK